jgi:uncharacterized protein
MNTLLVLSHIQAAELLKAKNNNQLTAVISTDLNLTQTEVKIHPDQVAFSDGRALPWSAVQEIAGTPNACFLVHEDHLQRIQSFSRVTNRYCSLMPTRLAPTLLIAGFPMHRIKDTDPYQDTLSKIRTLKPVVGRVLDTAMGLGYTAIQASKTANHVITIELDPAVIEIARLNPWSQALFNNPRISLMTGDCRWIVQDLMDGAFTRIVHDPPNFSLAGELYSGAFYKELFRLLSRGGRLFHYIGDLQSGSGRRIVPGVLRRLREAGFRQVRPKPESFGLVAQKW